MGLFIVPSYTIALAVCALCVFSLILMHFLVINDVNIFYFLLFLFFLTCSRKVAVSKLLWPAC